MRTGGHQALSVLPALSVSGRRVTIARHKQRGLVIAQTLIHAIKSARFRFERDARARRAYVVRFIRTTQLSTWYDTHRVGARDRSKDV